MEREFILIRIRNTMKWRLAKTFFSAALILLSLTSCAEWIKAVFYIDHMERDERISGMHINQIIETLNLKPGLKIADIGAGSGLFSREMAKRVDHGMVYAVDINKKLLKHIDQTNSRVNITNIKTVLAEENDPDIPEQVDLIFICDTLHYIDHQDQYIRTMSSYLKKGGRIAVIDFRKNWPPLSIKFTEDDLTGWMKSAGLTPINRYDFIIDEFFMVFLKK
jgi:cyclopropane fatty-acyl-phospholipid synthase-like methyltransferase